MRQNNPFSLMFGRSPYSVIHRQAQFNEIVETFTSENPATYAYIITGIRGSGKTVMLRNISEELSKRNDWIVIDGNPLGELIEPLSEKLLYEGDKTKLFLDWSLTFNLKILTLTINKKEKFTNPEVIFEKLLKRANENKKKVLITIDDVSSTKEMRKFANFYQSMIGKKYDLFLLMTGLKNNINALISSDSSSFLSRTPKIELLPLDEVEIAREYEKLLSIPFPLAISLSKLTNGYAFAYQVLGHLIYDLDKKEITPSLLDAYDRYLQTNGYDVIWKDLTPQEKQFCYDLVNRENGCIDKVKVFLDMKDSNYQNFRGRLIEKGILISGGHGKLEFTLPRFSAFVSVMMLFA